ncbi:MAG TPA: DinB family protein, partial [Roseiflexaceae bacterium]|nr:DinB family protein [Roseiflexaceae bacterium]
MDQGQLKPTLLDLLGRTQADQRALLADLSDAERNQPSAPDGWSIKDLLVHIAFWKRRQSERLAAAARGVAPDDEQEHFEQANARIYAEWRERPWAAVIEESERAYEELIERIQAIDDDALVDPNRFDWQNGRSLVSSIVGNGIWHPQAHMAQFYVDRGELPRATRLQEELTEQIGQFGDHLTSRGEALYNLACFYSSSGQIDKALALLPEALRLRPDLIEWSKEDADLVSLHGLPAYQA